MAEIKSTKKNQKLTWVVLILAIMLLVAYMIFTKDKVDKESALPIVESDRSIEKGIKEKKNSNYTKSAEETAIYLSLIGDRIQLGSDPNYTRSAMVQLINMVRTTAIEYNLKMNGQLDSLKERGLTIRDNTTASNLATDIKSIGKEVNGVITQLQREKFPELIKETERVKKALDAIDSAVEIADQKEVITEFFVSCGDVIKKMDLNKK